MARVDGDRFGWDSVSCTGRIVKKADDAGTIGEDDTDTIEIICYRLPEVS